MSLKDRLQIYLVTYNRQSKLEETLSAILSSPVKDFDITILDNASTDGSSEIIDECCRLHSNVKHVRHPINIGGNANICRAFEMGGSCGKEYFWILCDDDKYDFSNWKEVEDCIEAGEDVVCVSDYVFPSDIEKKDPAYQIFQLTFVPAGIYKSKLITDDVLMNMYDAISTMFQQACIAIKCINENKVIHVLSKPVVYNGLHFSDRVSNESVSYFRGGDDRWIMERRKKMLWVLGYANVITLLKNQNLQKRCMMIAITYKDIYGSWENFRNCMFIDFINAGYSHYFEEINRVLPESYRVNIEEGNGVYYKHFVERLFSIKRSMNRKYKVISLLGLKIKWSSRKNG